MPHQALHVVRNAVTAGACREVRDVMQNLPLTGEDGRQGTGYGKASLLEQLTHPTVRPVVERIVACLGEPTAFDAWWLTYPVGSHIPEHVDPAPVDGLCHLRGNLVVERGRGGAFVADGKHIDLDVGDLVVFRPDVVRHAVSVVVEPRALLSLGTLWDAPTVHAVLTAVRG